MNFPIAETFVYLIAAHFLLDYALQGDWMSKAKNPTLDLVPGESIWRGALIGHAWIHAAAVFVITGVWAFFVVELVLHTAADYLKCRGKFGYNADQAFHLGCKASFVITAWLLGLSPTALA